MSLGIYIARQSGQRELHAAVRADVAAGAPPVGAPTQPAALHPEPDGGLDQAQGAVSGEVGAVYPLRGQPAVECRQGLVVLGDLREDVHM